MILNWKSLREENPLIIQILEKKTGYKFDPAYGVLVNEENDQLTYAVLEGFFDDHGWFMSIIPTDFPNWNGIISDTQNQIVFNNPQQFEGVTTRNHAKSLLAGIAIKLFESTIGGMLKLPDGSTVLEEDKYLADHAKDKALDQISFNDLNLDGQGLTTVGFLVTLKRGDKMVVIKSDPQKHIHFPGLVLNA